MLGACAAWALVTAAGRDARPEGLLLAVLAVGAGYATGRIAGSQLPTGGCAGAAFGGVLLASLGPSSVHMISGSIQFAVPAERSGVTAALLTLSVGAACCAAWATPVRAFRVTLRLAAACTVAVAALLKSPAAFTAGLAVLLCSLAAGHVRRRLPALIGLALAAAAVTSVTFAVAVDALPRPVAAVVESQLTEHQRDLWQDAYHLARRQPLTGTGPGSFGELSPAARQAAASDSKPHSAPLQIAAEQGLPGAGLAGGRVRVADSDAVRLSAADTRDAYRCRGAIGTGGAVRHRQRAELSAGNGRRRPAGGRGHRAQNRRPLRSGASGRTWGCAGLVYGVSVAAFSIRPSA